MFNTEYNSDGRGDRRVIDAVAQFSFSDQFNIWAGRFLPPSDRANLYGPYYANHWGVYRDGVQDGYPFETEGRDDGVMYWGQFGIAKVSAGVFDVRGLTKGDSDVLYAGTRAARLLGSGRRLLPERHVLRRQGSCSPLASLHRQPPATTRTRSTSCSRRSSATAASLRSKRSTPSTTASAAIRRPTSTRIQVQV